jgi:hypothetical protein
MDISARSFLSFSASMAVSVTAASAIVLAPPPPAVHAVPVRTVADVQLTASPAEIEAAIARFQGFFDDVSEGAGQLAGIPGRGLIAAAGGIENFFDVALTRAIDGTTDPDAVESLTILRTLAVNAWGMLEHNLGRINPVISSTTEEVGKLVSGAVTGSAQNLLIALSGGGGLLSAVFDSGQLVLGNGLRVIHQVGGAGFEIAQIVVDELTYQVDNLIAGFSTLLTHVGDASASPFVAAALGAVRDLVLAPVRAVVDAGSRVISTVVTATHAGFDRVLDTATGIVDPPKQEQTAAVEPETRSSAVDPEPVEVDRSGQRVGDDDREVAVADLEDAAVDEAEDPAEAPAAEDAAEDTAAEDAAAEDAADSSGSSDETQTADDAPSTDRDAPSTESASAAA